MKDINNLSEKFSYQNFHLSKSYEDQLDTAIQAMESSLNIKLKSNQLEALKDKTAYSMVIMDTGEGKTYVAAIKAAILSLNNHVHYSTANEYLSERDYKNLKPFFDYLKIPTAFISDASTKHQRKEAYKNRIIFASFQTLAADNLANLLATSNDNLLFQNPISLIMDEADAVLIDSSTHPFSIVSEVEGDNTRYNEFTRLVLSLKEEHLALNPKTNEKFITEEGYRYLETLGVSVAEDVKAAPVFKNCLYAIHNLREGVDYVVVQKNDKTKIQLLTNGVLDINKKLSNGVMKALTYKVKSDLHDIADPKDLVILNQIPLSSIITMYDKVFALSGPVSTVEINEMRDKYKLKTREIPREKYMIVEENHMFYTTNHAKEIAFYGYIEEAIKSSDPLLIVTSNDNDAVSIHKKLKDLDIVSTLLLATDTEKRASVIEEASLPGRVTVSNMQVGRGVDIRVDPASGKKLHVVATSFPLTERSYLQLKGRTARNGDHGAFTIFASLEDLGSGVGKSASVLLGRREGSEENFKVIEKILLKDRRSNELTLKTTRTHISKLHEAVSPLYNHYINLRYELLTCEYKEFIKILTENVYTEKINIRMVFPVSRKKIVNTLTGVYPGYVPKKSSYTPRSRYVEELSNNLCKYVDNRLNPLAEYEKREVIQRMLLPILNENFSKLVNELNAMVKDNHYTAYRVIDGENEFISTAISMYKETIALSFKTMLEKLIMLEIKESK